MCKCNKPSAVLQDRNHEYESLLSEILAGESENSFSAEPGTDNTIYVPINIGHLKSDSCRINRNVTAVFFPKKFKPSQPVDIIVYFHGFLSLYPGNCSTAREYLNYRKNDYLRLREAVESSGKNVLLVVPTLGKKSETGRLLRPGSFDAYLKQVIAAAETEIVQKKFSGGKMKRGRLILAGHSGGGKPLLRLARLTQADEIWGFDSIYQGGSEWPAIAKSKPELKIFFYYKSDGNVYKTGAFNSIKRAKAAAAKTNPSALSNLQVIDVTKNPAMNSHFKMIVPALQERLAALSGFNAVTEWENEFEEEYANEYEEEYANEYEHESEDEYEYEDEDEYEDESNDESRSLLDELLSESPSSGSAAENELWNSIRGRLGKGPSNPAKGESLITEAVASKIFRESILAVNFKTSAGMLAALPADKRSANLATYTDQLVELMEKEFILNPNYSSLDLLPGDAGAAYRSFKWTKNDFPGNGGPNQRRARALAAELIAIRPERRPNSGSSLVIGQAQFCKNRALIYSTCKKTKSGLHPSADKSFAAMQAAAANTGVTLTIDNSIRYAQCANGKVIRTTKNTNTSAVGTYSSHMIGLAMDMKLSAGQLAVKEVTTRPFTQVIAMRTSPTHKFLFLKGAAYGWYPYMNEPWHWEYNPKGLKDTYMSGLNGTSQEYEYEEEYESEDEFLNELFAEFGSTGSANAALRENIAEIARNEHLRWNSGRGEEHNTRYKEALIEYYKGAGYSASAAAAEVNKIQTQKKGPPWSAAFISGVIRKALAGTGIPFRYSAAHRNYVRQAKINRINNDASQPFWAYRISEAKPEIGDLICNSRFDEKNPAAGKATFDNIEEKTSWTLHCDIVVHVNGNEIHVIGGNAKDHFTKVNGTVGKKVIKLNSEGYLFNKTDDVNTKNNRYIAIVKYVGSSAPVKGAGTPPPPSGNGKRPEENAGSKYAHAAKRNAVLAEQLGWNKHYMAIRMLIGVYFPVSPEFFAQYVAKWQAANGFGGDDADGIIGGKTWKKMQQQLGLSSAAPASTPASSPSGHPLQQPPADNGEVRITKVNQSEKNWHGWVVAGGGPLYNKLCNLRKRGELEISPNEMHMLRLVSENETRQTLSAVNTYDKAYLSMGFTQFTIAYNSIQKIISRFPDAFRKFGIELDGKAKYPGTKIQKIKGTRTPEDLRSLEWAKKFFAAGKDDAVIVALVDGTRERFRKMLHSSDKYGYLEEIGYRKYPKLWAHLYESYNWAPAYIVSVLKKVLPEAKRLNVTAPAELSDMIIEQFRNQYESSTADNAAKIREKMYISLSPDHTAANYCA